VSYRFTLSFVVGALLLLVGSTERAPAASMPLASHRAIYVLKLARANSNAAVNAAAGQLVIEWQDSCDGYTTNQRFLTEFSDSEGHGSTTDLWVSSWESHDGSVFRFNLTNSTNGVVQERSRGLAHRGGEVTFEQPKPEKKPLPPSTIFPTGHTEALIEAALRGEHAIERIVFDGGAENGLSYVSAFIGKEVAPKPAPIAAKGKGVPLTEGRAWPVRLAFYPYEKGDDLPDYEMSFLLHENGVATNLEFDYGDFAIAAELSKIEPLPGCTSNH
jgi:hypothetical protein